MTPTKTGTEDIKEQITYCVLNSISGETDPSDEKLREISSSCRLPTRRPGAGPEPCAKFRFALPEPCWPSASPPGSSSLPFFEFSLTNEKYNSVNLHD